MAAAVAIAVAIAAYAGQPDVPAGGGTFATGSPVLGSLDAPVMIVEFGDYQCHQCYNWFHNTKPALSREYIETGRASLVFVDMAFLGRDSPLAAQATYCAEDQGMYWEYHDMLYESQEPQIDNGWAGRERLKAFAFSMGLDTEEFDRCLDSGKHRGRVGENTSMARSYGVSGTPTFLIIAHGEETKIVGAQPLPVFRQAIDSVGTG